MSTELLHELQAICRNISLGFKAGIQTRRLCNQKAVQPPPEGVALCAEEADALSEPSDPSPSAGQGHHKHMSEHCHADLQPRHARAGRALGMASSGEGKS